MAPQQRFHPDEEVRAARVSAAETHVPEIHATTTAPISNLRTRLRASWRQGIVTGSIGAVAMTTLGRFGNPSLAIDGRDGWLFYALLGAILGFAMSTGNRRTSRAAAGMSAAVLISPPLLVEICRFLGQVLGNNPAESALVLVAAQILGAFTWLYRSKPAAAASGGAMVFFILDWIYNLCFSNASFAGLWQAAWISALHGAALGASLALVQRGGESFLKRLKGESPSNPEAGQPRTA